MVKNVERFDERNKSHHVSMDVEKYFAGMKTLGDILDGSPRQKDNIIYIHVPFCAKICSFCNMRRSLSKATDNYYDLLLDHLDILANTSYGKEVSIDSVYFGGGTPTTMSERDLGLVLDGIFEKFNINDNAEISMETTLTELSPDKLKNLSRHGLNRISIGVQTFNDRGKKLMGRFGDGEFAQNRIKDYLDLGFENVNIDLIYNYPYQSLEDLDEDMEIIANLNIAGFFMYSLILMEESRMAKKIDERAYKEKMDIKRDIEF